MEQSLADLIKNYEEKKITHPHIATLWQAYLKKEKYKIEQIINNGQQVFQLLDELEDISLPTLITIYSLSSQI